MQLICCFMDRKLGFYSISSQIVNNIAVQVYCIIYGYNVFEGSLWNVEDTEEVRPLIAFGWHIVKPEKRIFVRTS